MGRKSKNYTENYTEDYPKLDGINNLVPKQQTIKLTEEEWSELNNGSKGTSTSQTAVQELIDWAISLQYNQQQCIDWIVIKNKAESLLELEKQQIIDIVEKSRETGLTAEYLLLTYGSKGSDDHIVDTNEMVSSQTEISDEMSKIEKALYHAWSDYEYKEGNLYSTTFRDGWLMGIDWYKKKLNNK